MNLHRCFDVDEIWIEHDAIPCLGVCTDMFGQRNIFTLVDEVDEGFIYLLASCNTQQAENAKALKLLLSDLFRSSPLAVFFERSGELRHVTLADIPISWLPKEKV